MTAKKKATAVRKPVTLDELKKFVENFQEAVSLEAVAKVMNWSIEKVRTQATRLRKRGVALKDFPRQSKLSAVDIASLQGLCEGPDAPELTL